MASYSVVSNLKLDVDENGHIIFLNADGLDPNLFHFDDRGHLQMLPQTILEASLDDDGHLICKSLTYWDLWEDYLSSSSGSSGSGDTNQDALDSYISNLMEDPGYQPDATINGVITPIVAKRTSGIECALTAVPGTNIHVGDIVTCLQRDWLVEELYTDRLGMIHGTLWMCNQIIRFQNFSPPIHIRKCVLDNGLYRKKTTDPVAYVPHNTYELYLSIDSDTAQLFVDKRLAINLIYDDNNDLIIDAFKIMGIDLVTYNHETGDHLMAVLLQNDVYNAETDSIGLMLCDVYVEPDESSDNDDAESCLINGGDTIRLGTTRKYTASFFDAAGEFILGVTPVWTIGTIPSSITTTINEPDHSLSISVPLEEELIGTVIPITLSDENHIYGTFEKKVQVVTVG